MKLDHIYDRSKQQIQFSIDFFSAANLFVSCFHSFSESAIVNCWKKCQIYVESPLTVSVKEKEESLSLKEKSENEGNRAQQPIIPSGSELDNDGFQKIPDSVLLEFDGERKRLEESSENLEKKLLAHNLNKGNIIGDGVCVIMSFFLMYAKTFL
jgi:hypothetical protein